MIPILIHVRTASSPSRIVLTVSLTQFYRGSSVENVSTASSCHCLIENASDVQIRSDRVLIARRIPSRWCRRELIFP